jgi:iron-sulfur cluster repair protein YtfE (RIC family)
MSLFDKVVAAVTPPETNSKRAEARQAAQALAGVDDWLGLALEHHREIESCFDAAKAATDAPARLAAAKRLSVILTAHANAEESVLYPMIAEDHKGHAATAYQEQAMTKVELARLERIEPMSQDWVDKLEHIRGAVLHHMYEEEGTWFPELFRKAGASGQPALTFRFREEFERMRGSRPVTGG